MLQRGALDSQLDGSAVGSAQNPICVLQNSQDVLTLGFFQRLLLLRIGAGWRRVKLCGFAGDSSIDAC